MQVSRRGGRRRRWPVWTGGPISASKAVQVQHAIAWMPRVPGVDPRPWATRLTYRLPTLGDRRTEAEGRGDQAKTNPKGRTSQKTKDAFRKYVPRHRG